MSTMSRAQFKELARICRAYDPFTQYIDNYRQMKQAEECNRELSNRFDEIMNQFGIDTFIPCTNDGAKTEENLMAWLGEYGITVEQVKKRVWTEQEIKDLVQTNDKVLYGALKNLYNQQTADEQMVGETRVHNNAGFNGADSRFLSSTAEFLKKTGFLTDKQKVIVRRKLVKYTKQLTRLANA